MKLSVYAKKIGVTYKTAYTHFKLGYIKGVQLPTGTIFVEEGLPSVETKEQSCVLYARVSSSENKDNLESQLTRLRNYANLKGYKIVKEVAEVGSGLNDNRRKLLTLLSSEITYNIILVEHKDRFARFGTSLVETLLNKLKIKLEIINTVEHGKEDIIQDLVSIVTSFSARIYGNRRSKRRTITLLNELNKKTNKSEDGGINESVADTNDDE
jgi:putative resolvase